MQQLRHHELNKMCLISSHADISCVSSEPYSRQICSEKEIVYKYSHKLV